MIVRKLFLRDSYSRVDRNVFSDSSISDGSARLYGYLAGLKSGANFSDKYIMLALNISRPVLNKRKRELKDKGLIHIEKLTDRVYVLYVGSLSVPAKVVKTMWDTEDD